MKTEIEMIAEIKSQIDSVQANSRIQTHDLEVKALNLFSEMLDKSPLKSEALKKMLVAVENSPELTNLLNDDWYAQFARVDFSLLIDTKDKFQRELLQNYLESNHHMGVDFDNDCLTLSIGPAIIINDQGDVLDQETGKWIIKKSDYIDEADLYAQIEAYMEKTGCFPSVVEADYYGNPTYVNTNVKKESK